MAVQILAALGSIAGGLSSTATAIKGAAQAMKGVATFVGEMGLTGYGGLGLKTGKFVFEGLENLPLLKELQIDMGSKYLTPFGTLLYWEEINRKINQTNRQLGIAGQLGLSIGQNIRDAGTDAIKFGFAEKEIVDEFAAFTNEFGRNALLSDEDLLRMTKISFAFGESYNQIFSLTKLYGASIEDTYDFLEETNRQADKFGLNAKKTFGTIQSNITLIDKFAFKNGINGLRDMAVQADRLGLKMQSIAGFADKVYDPEGAIEVSAALQMMGGEFAQMGDFSTLLYNANNDLEGLGDMMSKVTRNMGALNKETGMIDLTSLEFRQLRTLAQTTGQNLEEVVQNAKLLRKEDLITKALSPDFKKLDGVDGYIAKIANIATFENGIAKIEIKGQKKLVSELGQKDMEALSQITGDKQVDSMNTLITSNQTQTEKLQILAHEMTRLIQSQDALEKQTAIMSMLTAAGNKSLTDGSLKDAAELLQTAMLSSTRSIDRVAKPLFEGDISGSLSGFWQNLRSDTPENKAMIAASKKMAGEDSFISKSIDAYVYFQDGAIKFVEGVGDFIEAIGNFNLKTLFFGKENDNKGFSTMKNITTSSIMPILGPAMNVIEGVRKGASYLNQSSMGTESEALTLFKQNKEAQTQFISQMNSRNQLEISSSNSNHVIEFKFNGKTYNTYDLFQDEKLKKELEKTIGSVNANVLLSKNSQGGKNAQPTDTFGIWGQ